MLAFVVASPLTSTVLAVPPNDQFANRGFLFGIPSSATVNTAGATTELGELKNCGSIGATVWYQLNPGVTGAVQVTADTFGSDFDTVLNVYADPLGLLGLPVVSYGVGQGSGTPTVGCNDDSGGTLQSSVTFVVVTGFVYYIQAGGFSSATGNLKVNIHL